MAFLEKVENPIWYSVYMVIPVYKNRGETPLAALTKVKSENPDYTHIPMTYAGRLDPMAEGLLLILTGDDCIKKDEYTALSKEYEVTVLFGFATDTYDLLGLVTPSEILFERSSDLLTSTFGQTISNSISDSASVMSALSKTLPKFSGKLHQKYPPYSSRTVNGKPLFQWAREGKLNEIEIPTHEVFVSNIEITKVSQISKRELEEYIDISIKKVVGDFRQVDIVKRWNDVLMESPLEEFPIVTFSISCSSGTYVRAIAHEMGELLGIPTLAMKIVRTKIGDYTI